MLANNEREHATYRAQTRDERSDKRYGMLANQESMQPSAHKQESGAQIRVMAGSLEPCTGTRWTPRQKTWHARKQTRTVNHLASLHAQARDGAQSKDEFPLPLCD